MRQTIFVLKLRMCKQYIYRCLPFICFSLGLFGATSLLASEVSIENVSVRAIAQQQSDQSNTFFANDNEVRLNQYRFDVTLKHKDTGWDHYANAWQVMDMSGKLLAKRVLHHPHVNEQPFTRSLNVELPIAVEKVEIVAFDSINEGGKASYMVVLPR